MPAKNTQAQCQEEPTYVYLVHDAGGYREGAWDYVRGVFSTRDKAEAYIASRSANAYVDDLGNLVEWVKTHDRSGHKLVAVHPTRHVMGDYEYWEYPMRYDHDKGNASTFRIESFAIDGLDSETPAKPLDAPSSMPPILVPSYSAKQDGAIAHEYVVPLAGHDDQVLLVCALRYAMGRSSYMPSLVCGFLEAHMSSIDPSTASIMARDIRDWYLTEYQSLKEHFDSKGIDWHCPTQYFLDLLPALDEASSPALRRYYGGEPPLPLSCQGGWTSVPTECRWHGWTEA